ncbi:MAG TPA: hypothetical protein DGT23_33585 [Micromonosporaceae bacterium]|nr:hypothetical protein [Micromonosporaceae bacterium]
MRTSILTRLALTGLIALAATAGISAPASAVPGLVRVIAVSAFDSAPVKEALAQCPAGTRVLGGGGFIAGGGGNVHLIRLQALGSSDRFAAAAAETGVYAGNWRVTSYAVCGQQPAGLTYLSFQTASDSDGHKLASIDCPAGMLAISHGARVTGDGGNVVIRSLGTMPGFDGTMSGADEVEGGYAGNWSLFAYVVCANPLPGQQTVWADTLPADSENDTIAVNCPAGKRVHGTGSVISSSFGEVFYQGIVPNAALTGVTAWAVEDTNGAAQNWWTRVFAVCAF